MPSRLATPDRRAELESASRPWRTRDLPPAAVDQLELYLTGALDELTTDPAAEATVLCDPEGIRLAILTPDGTVEGLQLPTHYDFTSYRKTPAELEHSSKETIAYFTDKPILRGEFESIRAALAEQNARLLILASSSSGDHFHTMRCLKLLPLDAIDAEIVLLPIPPDDVTTQTAIAKNYGATRLLLPEGLQAQPPAPEFTEIQSELERRCPPRLQQGLTLFFTGLSGSGKSTISQIVEARLRERGGRHVTSLDGDVVRKTLSSGLGFSREDRNRNILRIGWVASQINKNGGIAICAPIAPYDAIRKEVRAMSAEHGAFILIHVATPLEVCEARDRKGLYAKARAGIIKEFTGISDPYEEPADAELTLQTTELSAAEAADCVLRYFEKQGYVEI